MSGENITSDLTLQVRTFKKKERTKERKTNKTKGNNPIRRCAQSICYPDDDEDGADDGGDDDDDVLQVCVDPAMYPIVTCTI